MSVKTLRLACLLAAALPVTAEAHPHAFIDASLTAIFDNEGRLTAIHEEWAFDNNFGDSLRLQADANRDDVLDDAERSALGELIVRTLAPSGFYTQLVAGGQLIPLGGPSDLAARIDRYRLKVSFTLPLAEPISTGTAGIDLFDAELNFAVAWVSPPLEGVNLPAGCSLIRRDRIPDDPAWRDFMAGAGGLAALSPDPAEGYPVRAILACPD